MRLSNLRIIFGGGFGGCLGFAISEFIKQSNWGMVCLSIGVIVGVFYIVLWIIEVK